MNLLNGMSTVKRAIAGAVVTALVAGGTFTGLAVTNSGPFACGPSHGVALGLQVGTPAGACPAPGATSSNCQFQNPLVVQPAVTSFCDSFNGNGPQAVNLAGERSGDLNGTIWGSSRNKGVANAGGGQADTLVGGLMQGTCVPNGSNMLSGVPVIADQDLKICNGQLNDMVNDNPEINSTNTPPWSGCDNIAITNVIPNGTNSTIIRVVNTLNVQTGIIVKIVGVQGIPQVNGTWTMTFFNDPNFPGPFEFTIPVTSSGTYVPGTGTELPQPGTIVNGVRTTGAVNCQNDDGDVTSLAFYPKQPFDWSADGHGNGSRVGTAVFDVSNDSMGNHAAWPEFWISDKPVPDPFVHFNSWQAIPQYGLGIRLDATCMPGQGPQCGGACPNTNTSMVVGIDSIDVINNYVADDSDGLDGNGTHNIVLNRNGGGNTVGAMGCVVEPVTNSGQLNHYEFAISTTEIRVYATDAFTPPWNPATTPLKVLLDQKLTGADILQFTRGLVWGEDVHYNGSKDVDPGPAATSLQGMHTFSWSNFGFDGPQLPRDLTFDGADALLTSGFSPLCAVTPSGGGTTTPCPNEENIGYCNSLTPAVCQNGSTPSVTLNIGGITQANIDASVASFVMFLVQPQNGATTMQVTVNGHLHSYPWPFVDSLPDGRDISPRTFAVPIATSDLVVGTNVVKIADPAVTNIFVSNVDILLAGAGGPGGPIGSTTTTTTTTSTTIPSTTTTTTAAPPGNVSVKVSGNRLVTANGSTFVPHGVNRDGTEYACVQFGGPFDGPSDDTSVTAMASWNINIVRLGLNEDCWLGINGQPIGGVTQASYQAAIVNYVNLLHTHGLAAILELHLNAPGTTVPSTSQNPMPDSDHSVAFWTSVANTFKGDPGVLFDLFNEPFPDSNQNTTAAWTCLRDGGTCAGVSYPVAGMQTLTTAVRATGSTNVIMVGGIQFANVLDQWLTFKPNDTANQTAASYHTYQGQVCATVSCWNATIAPVAAVVPVITGEFGEGDQASTFIDAYSAWADPMGIGYLGWTWDTYSPCASSIVLISNYDGTPCPGYGVGYKAHLASLANSLVSAPSTWSNVTNNLGNMASECGNLTSMSVVPNTNQVLAGVAASGLWSSVNGGASWVKLGTGAGGTQIGNRPTQVLYDPTNPSTWWEAGIYGSNFGVFKTTNSGSTFAGLGSEFHMDSIGVDFTDPARQTLLDGGHETSAKIDLSINGGATWTNLWPSLSARLAGAFTPYVMVLNANTFLVAASQGFGGGTPGIYRTTNGQQGINATWTQVSAFGPNAHPLVTSDGTIYWPLNNSLIKSTDQGVTWTQVGLSGGIQTDSGTGQGITPIQLPAPDNRLVTIGTGNTLIVSSNGGVSWSTFGATFPGNAAGRSPEDVVYSPPDHAFFTSHWDCTNIVPTDAIQKGT